MLRVAYVFERFPSFGQTFCYREVAALIAQGAEVTIFSLRRPKDEPPQDWDADIIARIVYLPEEKELVLAVDSAVTAGELPARASSLLKGWGRQADFLRLYQAAFIGLRLRKAGLRRVHAHFAGMAARTAHWINRFFEIDYSLTAHANDIFAPRDFVIGLADIVAGARAVVTVSDFSAEHLRRQFPAEAPKVHRIYNGIDASAYRTATLENGPPVIISVGRLIEKKGFADLIGACAELKKRGRTFLCKIVGEGPLQEALTRQIAEAQLGLEVELVGPQSSRTIARLLTAANVFALPCRVEADGGMDNLPTVIMEAMASGLPVVSTPLAGIPEMVAPDVTGALVEPGDVGALASAIQDIIKNLPLARRLGSAGRRMAEERFSLAGNVKQLAGILEAGS